MIQLNKYSLRFASKQIEADYNLESSKQTLVMARLSIPLAISLYAIFGILDLWMVPEKIPTIWAIRISECMILSLIYYLSFKRFFAQYIHIIMSGVVLIIALGILAMVEIVQTEGGYFYYAGLILVIQFAHGTRIKFSYATSVTILIAIIYIVIAGLIKTTPATLILNNLFFLIASIIIGMFISYTLEYYIRRNYWQKVILTRQQKLLEYEHSIKSKELNDMRIIQQSLIPEKLPDHPVVEIAATLKTASEVGGDFYDFHLLNSDTLIFAIGDATGHGAKAGAMVTAVKFIFSCFKDEKDLIALVRKISIQLKNAGFHKMFMSFALGRLKKNNLELVGAGMPAAIIFKSNKNSIYRIPLKGMPLGSVNDFPYKNSVIELDENDTIVFMSDGFPELSNTSGEMIGYNKITDIFYEVASQTPAKIIEHFIDYAKHWGGDIPLQDDLTFIVMKVKSPHD